MRYEWKERKCRQACDMHREMSTFSGPELLPCSRIYGAFSAYAYALKAQVTAVDQFYEECHSGMKRTLVQLLDKRRLVVAFSSCASASGANSRSTRWFDSTFERFWSTSPEVCAVLSPVMVHMQSEKPYLIRIQIVIIIMFHSEVNWRSCYRTKKQHKTVIRGWMHYSSIADQMVS